MDRLGIEEGEHIEHRFISKAIENAQSKVEGHNFEIRKHLLEYDDVMNQQREIIYRQRRQALKEEDLKPVILDMIEDLAYDTVEAFAPEKTQIKSWDIEGMENEIRRLFNQEIALDQALSDNYSIDQTADLIFSTAKKHYEAKEALIGAEQMRQLERFIILQTVDARWKEHLLAMDHLKEGIGLRGYAQQDPLRIYKKEGFDMFQGLTDRIKEEVVDILFKIQLVDPSRMEEMKKEEEQDLTFSHAGDAGTTKQPVKRSGEKVQRNDPCPCGSGKKYKKCCMV